MAIKASLQWRNLSCLIAEDGKDGGSQFNLIESQTRARKYPRNSIELKVNRCKWYEIEMVLGSGVEFI